MGDRIGVLNKGRIIQIGKPNEVYNNPRDTFVASFVGSPAINLIPGRLSGGKAIIDAASFQLPIERAAPEGAYTFGIRSEDVIVQAGAPVQANVHDIENHGIEKILTLRSGGHFVRASVPGTVNVAVEEVVSFGWNASKVKLFDPVSGLNIDRSTN